MFYLMHQQNPLADPGLALLLLGAGVLGVCWELSRSGLIVPGVAGSVCIVLALGSPATVAFDVRGIVLVAVAILFFALEAALRSRGLLTLVGAAALMAGLLLLDRGLAWALAAGAALLFSLLISFLLSVAVQARRSKLAILDRGEAAHS
jgi:membrane-bound serine protease (ClpP class)